MHYAFAPGATLYDIQSRRLLDDRPGTVLISAKSIKHVAAFLSHLATTAAIPKPIGGDLYLGSHGNHRGWMHIDLDGTSRSKPPMRSLRLPSTLGRLPFRSISITTPTVRLADKHPHPRLSDGRGRAVRG